MARHNPGLRLEARQLREFGWTQQRIGETLDVPQTTVSLWLRNTAKPVSNGIAKAALFSNNGMNNLATSITLYQAKYEEIGDKIPPESIICKTNN